MAVSQTGSLKMCSSLLTAPSCSLPHSMLPRTLLQTPAHKTTSQLRSPSMESTEDWQGNRCLFRWTDKKCKPCNDKENGQRGKKEGHWSRQSGQGRLPSGSHSDSLPWMIKWQPFTRPSLGPWTKLGAATQMPSGQMQPGSMFVRCVSYFTKT